MYLSGLIESNLPHEVGRGQAPFNLKLLVYLLLDSFVRTRTFSHLHGFTYHLSYCFRTGYPCSSNFGLTVQHDDEYSITIAFLLLDKSTEIVRLCDHHV